MSEQTKTKKKLSIGKVWILVCIAAVVLGLLVAYAGLIVPEMERYNEHEHAEWCGDENALTSDCIQIQYDNAFSYADGPAICIVFGGGALILANVVMGIIYAARKSKKAQAVENTTPTVSISTGEREQVVLARRYPAAFPCVLMVLGVLSVLFGVPFFDEIGIPLLIVGAIFLVVGILLSKLLKTHLVVTTKRVYLKAPFAARLNLPLNRISAVGTGLFHHLSITSAAGFAGQIRLWFVPKYLEVYDTINALLNDIE